MRQHSASRGGGVADRFLASWFQVGQIRGRAIRWDADLLGLADFHDPAVVNHDLHRAETNLADRLQDFPLGQRLVWF